MEFQTPDSLPYSTPPLDKRDEETASHDDDDDEASSRTPLARKHKLLKYVEQPQQSSKLPQPGKSDLTTGTQFSMRDHVDKFQSGSGSSEQRRDPPPSSLYGEAINLKVEKKEESPPAKKDERRVLRGRSGGSATPAEVPKVEEQVFPRLVEVWSEKDRKEVETKKEEEPVVVIKTPEKQKQKEEAPPVQTSISPPALAEKPKLQEITPPATEVETISPQRTTRGSPKKLEKEKPQPVVADAKPVDVEKEQATPTKVEEPAVIVLPPPPPLEKMGTKVVKVHEEAAATPVLTPAPAVKKEEVIKATAAASVQATNPVPEPTVAEVIEQKKVESTPPKPVVVEEKSVQPPTLLQKVSPQKTTPAVVEQEQPMDQTSPIKISTTPTKKPSLIESPKSNEKVKPFKYLLNDDWI